MYRTLQADKIVATADQLSHRVAERFPGSGLSQVAAELADASRDLSRLAARIRRPIVALRLFSVLVSTLFIILIVAALVSLRPSTQVANASELAQGVESLINDVVFAGLAIWFFFTIESRIKRKRVLGLVAQLRSLAHVIDMHQLTKDPDRLNKDFQGTAASPRIALTPPLLTRYLDYCGEMLAIIGKLGALLVQDFNDAQALNAVNDIEELTSGLQRKIWQKIMIIDRVFDTRSLTPHGPSIPSAAAPASPRQEVAGAKDQKA